MTRLAILTLSIFCLIACDAAERALVPSAQAAPPKAAKPAAAPSAPAAASGDAELIARGAGLVNLGGCGDCHTPMRFEPALNMPVPNRALLLSGHPKGAPEPASQPGQGDQAVIGATFTSFRLPFGVVYSANLTPHKESGLGRWTTAQFISTMRTGHHQGTGRPLLPPMPWQNLSTASDADLTAIFAYLQSIPAIDNRVPAPQVPPPVFDEIAKSYKAAAQLAAKH